MPGEGRVARLVLVERTSQADRITCSSRFSSGGWRRVAGAYASLEDSLAGRMALVARAGRYPGLAARCGPASRLPGAGGAPWEVELESPPSKTLRRGDRFEVIAKRRLGPGGGLDDYAGVARVRVRFTYFPPESLAEELQKPLSRREPQPSASR